MRYEVYIPRRGFSVRPPDLPPEVCEQLRAAAPIVITVRDDDDTEDLGLPVPAGEEPAAAEVTAAADEVPAPAAGEPAADEEPAPVAAGEPAAAEVPAPAAEVPASAAEEPAPAAEEPAPAAEVPAPAAAVPAPAAEVPAAAQESAPAGVPGPAVAAPRTAAAALAAAQAARAPAEAPAQAVAVQGAPAPVGAPVEGPPPVPATAEADAGAGDEPPGRRRRLRRLAEVPFLLAGALLVAFVIKTFLLQAYYIPSESMVPALEVGDRVLVEKVTYRWREPQRGEVIVFERPDAAADSGIGPAVRSFFEDLGLVRPDGEIALIKRVVGLPGERVEVRHGTVLVNGRALEGDSALSDNRSFPAVTVPDGSYYLLGDNRANSDDSRYSLGAVPREAIVGRAFVVLWPPGNASLSLRTDYAGGELLSIDTRRRAPSTTPPALPQSTDAPEAPPP